ncbi:signal peptidase II [Roseitranquillus sediminis]|uniref:signal peptidase II n=1 Tax=Roseitranquillus sediminis TaxID=2809051 RepID=UPI001D0CD42F|nr:signal peptidase II [Roseitranquillus sediminis]MBM9593672.1 signal peptidase II [Roseitranquillus sediminis]
MRWTVWTALATLALDQITKVVVVWWMDLALRGVIEVWPPYLTLRMAWNRGVNFGLFAGGDTTRWILIALALGIAAWVGWWMWRQRPGPAVQASAGLLIGGAVGNVIDRLLYGAVADFLNMSCCGIENPYAFNVADIAIFLGAAGLALLAGDGRNKRS